MGSCPLPVTDYKEIVLASAGFILEEGTSMEDFWKVVSSMREAAAEAGVALVTGDTKVVDRGKADKIFINTGEQLPRIC